MGAQCRGGRRGRTCCFSPVHRSRSLEPKCKSCSRETAPGCFSPTLPPCTRASPCPLPLLPSLCFPPMLLFYLFPLSAASKHLRPVAIAPPVPEMPFLPTILPDFSPKEAGWLQPLPVPQAGPPDRRLRGTALLLRWPSLLSPAPLFLAAELPIENKKPLLIAGKEILHICLGLSKVLF